MMRYVLSFVFLVVFFVSLLFWATVIALSFGLSYPERFARARLWVVWVLGVLKKLCGLDYEVEGAANVPDEAAVIYSKHGSVWETIASIAYCPPHTWVLKRELMWVPLFGQGLKAMRAIAIDRRGRVVAAQQVVEQGMERLQSGISVMIYPEGTRVVPGKTRRYGKSGALLAVGAGRPLVPIAHNAGDYWPRRRLLKRAGTIRVCIGPAIATAGKTAEEVNAEAKNWIDAKMAEISPAHAPQSSAAGDKSNSAASV